MAETCQNCKARPATQFWVADGGTIALVHGCYQRWCDVCVVTAQLAHARAMAEQIATLEVRLHQLKMREQVDAP